MLGPWSEFVSDTDEGACRLGHHLTPLWSAFAQAGVSLGGSWLNININAKHWKPFGCPVYVLESALQANQPYHK